MDIVGSTHRRNIGSRIGCSAAEVILSVWANAKVGSIPVEADFAPKLQRVGARCYSKTLLRLKQISKRRNHRSCSGIEGFELPVIKLQSRVGSVRSRERRSAPRNPYRR